MQIPSVVAEARAALDAGQCVVIGLQSTGEAAVDAAGLEPGPCSGFVSTTKEMLLRCARLPHTRGAHGEMEAGTPSALHTATVWGVEADTTPCTAQCSPPRCIMIGL